MITEVQVRWSTPTRTVDERLTVTSTGEARLLVLAPQREADLVGEFSGQAGPDEYAVLAAAGPRWSVDSTHTTDGAAALAAEIADRCRTTPVAAAWFLLRAAGAPGDDRGSLTLGVVGRGRQPCRFLLDLPRCRVRFLAVGELAGEQPLPPLASGFMTGDAEGLGGVRQTASVPPDTLGAIALDLPIPSGVTHAEVVLVGSWFCVAADETEPPEHFTARAVAELTG